MSDFTAVVRTCISPNRTIVKRATVLSFIEKPENVSFEALQALVRRQFEAIATDEEYAYKFENKPIIYIVTGDIVEDKGWFNLKNCKWTSSENTVDAEDTTTTKPDVKTIWKSHLFYVQYLVCEILMHIKEYGSSALCEYASDALSTYGAYFGQHCAGVRYFASKEFNLEYFLITFCDVKVLVNIPELKVTYVNDLMGIDNTDNIDDAFAKIDELDDFVYTGDFAHFYNKSRVENLNYCFDGFVTYYNNNDEDEDYDEGEDEYYMGYDEDFYEDYSGYGDFDGCE